LALEIAFLFSNLNSNLLLSSLQVAHDGLAAARAAAAQAVVAQAASAQVKEQ
jgi:hypothetical protein